MLSADAHKQGRGYVAYYTVSDAGRWKTLGVPVVIGGNNLPSPVWIGLTDLTNIEGASGPPGPPGSGTTDCNKLEQLKSKLENIIGI